MIRRRTITSYEWHVATGNETVVLLDCVKSFFRRLELIGGTEQLTTTGKNLFDIKKASDTSNYITTETLAKIDITAAIVFDVKKNTNYCLSVSGKTEQPSINFNIANDVQRKSIFNKLKTEETLNSLDSGKIYVGFSGGDTELNATKLSQEYFDIQLEEASSKTPYEPYTGGKPSPSPEYPQEIKSAGKYDEASGEYLLDVKVTGKNLFNAEKAKDANNWTNSTILPSYKEISIYVGKGNSVNISYLENLETGLGFYANIAHSENDYTMYWLYHSDSAINITKNKNFISRNDYIILRVDGGSVPKFFEYIKTLQIEIGSRQTPYEPYTEQTMQIALDEPLRGIGEYKDTITKDGVVRKIYEQTLKKERISMNEYNWDRKFFRLYVNSDKKIDSSINIHELFSNMFKKFVIYKNNPNVYWIISEEEIRSIGITEADSLQVAYEKIKDFVTTNDIVIQYPIVETTLEPLPESVPAQLQALHTENGTTHINIDSGEVETGINIEYKYKS